MKLFFNTIRCAIAISLTNGIIFLPSINAQTLSIKFDHFTVDDGLSQSTVNCILQDSRGFMWFGTQDGLNKYDGYTFITYKHDPFDSTTISDNYIRSIYEDNSGVLWIGTRNGGLNQFDRTKETFTNYIHNPSNLNSLASNEISYIVEDDLGIMWIGTWGGGLDKFDTQNKQFTHFQHDPSNPNTLSDNQIRFLYIDKNGFLWVGTEAGGLNRYHLKMNTFKSFQYDPNDLSSISHDRIQVIKEDAAGNFWVGTKLGLNLFDREKEKFTRFPLTFDLKSTEVTSIEEGVTGNLWIGTSKKGICRFDPTTNFFECFKNDPNNPSSMVNSGILSLYKDNTNLMWIGTQGAGIDRFNLVPKFKYYSHISNNVGSLSDPSIRGIFEDQYSVLWVGSYGGLDKFDRKNNKSTHYNYDPNNTNSLKNNNVYSIIEDIDGTLWIGTEGGGLNHFNKESEIFTQYLYNNEPDSPDGNYIFVLRLGENGDLLIGTGAGLFKLSHENKKTGHFLHYSLGRDEPTVTSILEDQKGLLWIGTEMSGLLRVSKDGSIASFKYSINDPNSLSSDRIKCIYQDRSGIIWFGTNGGGLNRFESKNQTFKYYTEKDGLPNDVIYGILEDDDYNLWLSTNKGISKFNPVEETFRNYDVTDGLQSNEFNTGSYYKSWTGEMFFGGINGLNSFFPNIIQDDVFTTPIVLTDFLIFNESVPLGEWKKGRSILQNHISETHELNLSYKDRIFSFMFSALSFSAPGKNQYAYKMEGFDQDWVYTDASKRFATYTLLPAGDYVFKVKGTNQDGIWNEEGVSLPIKITPPPWKTWWAYTIYFLTVLGTVIGTINWRLIRMKKRTKMLEKLVNERTTEIQHKKEELEKQYDFLNSVIESLSQPFYVLDANTREVVLINTAAKRWKISGKLTCYSVLHGRDQPCNSYGDFCPLPGIKKTKQLITFERTGVNIDGKTFFAEINAYPIFNKEGNVVQMIENWTDITVRKELENTLKENLEHRNKELTSKALRMAKDREVLIGIVKDVQDLYLNNHKENKTSLRNVLNKLNEQIKSGHEWDEFELWFQEVHKDFYSNLHERYPDLVSREMKICAFLKLNLNTKEIASLTNLTVKTIEVYRSKLRKKLNVPSGINLLKFINEI